MTKILVFTCLLCLEGFALTHSKPAPAYQATLLKTYDSYMQYKLGQQSIFDKAPLKLPKFRIRKIRKSQKLIRQADKAEVLLRQTAKQRAKPTLTNNKDSRIWDKSQIPYEQESSFINLN